MTSLTGGSLEHGLQLPAEGGLHAKAPPCKLRLHLPTQILVRLRISLCFASNDHGRNMATVHTWKHEAIKNKKADIEYHV